jgi:Ycf66 protein N-terminus
MINIVGSPFMYLISTIFCVQGFYLLSLAWIRLDIARYIDILLGVFAVFSGLIFWVFNFRMENTSQFLAFLLCSISIFCIFETVRQRQ